MAQEIVLKQIQTIDQRIIQTNRILQLSASGLEDLIREEAETNPVVEIVEDSGFRGRKQLHETDDFSSEAIAAERQETLQDHLYAQIPVSFPPSEQRVLDHLLDSLDENGYLRINAADTAKKLGVRTETVMKMRELIRSLEPAGVGAADLSDCLELQLKASGYTDVKLYRFVREGLGLLAEGRTAQLRALLHADDEEIAGYAGVIRTLDPRPGSAWEKGEKTVYIEPDVYVEKTDTGFALRFNDHLFHRIRIQEEYRTMYRSLSAEEKSYIRGRMNRAGLLIRSIEQRERMIMSLCMLILQKQRRFFEEGEGHLHSLRMQEAADELRVHVSTVSRAVSGKYMECEWGIYPLKYFFVQGKEGQPVRTDIVGMIRKIVAEEDPDCPLSDHQISTVLKEQGIICARRTVGKYRREAGIPEAGYRKRYGRR